MRFIISSCINYNFSVLVEHPPVSLVRTAQTCMKSFCFRQISKFVVGNRSKSKKEL